jgi:hypothetical protein
VQPQVVGRGDLEGELVVVGIAFADEDFEALHHDAAEGLAFAIRSSVFTLFRFFHGPLALRGLLGFGGPGQRVR